MPRQLEIRQLAFMCGLALLAACAGRARQPIVQPAPTPATATEGTTTGDATGGTLPSEQVNGSTTDDGSLSPNDGSSTSSSTSSSSSVSTATSTSSKMLVTTVADDGSMISVEWDGVSFMGNDKFDIQLR